MVRGESCPMYLMERSSASNSYHLFHRTPPPPEYRQTCMDAHGCEFLMVHALSGFWFRPIKNSRKTDVSGVPQPENSSQTTSVAWARERCCWWTTLIQWCFLPKHFNPDLVYSNLAGWISYDMISQPFFFWFSQIHPLKCLNLEGIYPWWSRECQAQPKMCRMLRGCCGLGSGCNLTLKVHPWKLTWNLKTPNWNGNHLPNLHFWVPAVSFPGCIG